jgi:deoxyribose-phosphate aldolase
MGMTAKEIAAMMDISAVQAYSTLDDIDECVAKGVEYGVAAIFTLPAHTPYLVEKLQGTTVMPAGVAAFPGGAESTATKAATAAALVKQGCREVDMVNNIAWLKANRKADYCADVRAVVEAAGVPVKVILECHWLTAEEIVRACEWAVESGASWVKTGTGWAPTGATPERVTLMAKTVGGRARVKAAGGIRDLATLLSLYDCGARRFGIGIKSAGKILQEIGE